jgi:4-hydroxy-4-methyl-2-oxoglutarate aldolase
MTLSHLTAVDVVQADSGRVRLAGGLSALLPDVVLSGPAFTCACAPMDNFALHRALAAAPAGCVLVCDAGGRVDGGYFGELMATDAANRGVLGLVIDGSFRDSVQLAELRFPVFGRGTAPISCAKVAPGSIGEPVRIGGVEVRSGDQIVGDPDALAVVAEADWAAVQAQARVVQRREDVIADRLSRGEPLAEIIGLDLRG